MTIVTRESLTRNGVVQAKYPPSPAITGLVRLLKEGTNSELKAGAGLLESAGRAGNLYEHTAGLALDIYRLASSPTKRAQAHNLIRLFIRNRESMGWHNMFYENWGFGRNSTQGSAPHHFDHIHIDWMDFSKLTYEGTKKFDRKSWMKITWPVAAESPEGIYNAANVELVKRAWNDTSAAPLTLEEITSLYAEAYN